MAHDFSLSKPKILIIKQAHNFHGNNNLLTRH